ncbi:hypothetical protein N566_27625 [Streptomycetaceae bacterium MP113-05]|nr:hypothetical protein N566_27625 [Streptomycetaceae bacterium MP113-05]
MRHALDEVAKPGDTGTLPCQATPAARLRGLAQCLAITSRSETGKAARVSLARENLTNPGIA